MRLFVSFRNDNVNNIVGIQMNNCRIIESIVAPLLSVPLMYRDRQNKDMLFQQMAEGTFHSFNGYDFFFKSRRDHYLVSEA